MVSDSKLTEKMIKKSYVLTKLDLENMRAIKNKGLEEKIFLNDSHIVRLGLMQLSTLSSKDIIKLAKKLPKSLIGRPKQHQ